MEHSSNASAEPGRKKHVSFASRQRKAASQCTNSGRHDKPKIHSGSTPSLQPRFGTVRLPVVTKIEGDVKRSTLFIGHRSRGGCAQMDQHPTRNFLHGRNDWKKCVAVNGKLCWKISVRCVREINLFCSDITVIILHCQNLISNNWRYYLSVTSRMFKRQDIKEKCCCHRRHFIFLYNLYQKYSSHLQIEVLGKQCCYDNLE